MNLLNCLWRKTEMKNGMIRKSKSKNYYKDGKLHREDGPSIEFDNGSTKWHRFGRLHREDGPAIDLKSIKKWYKEGKLHRLDGPATIENGFEQWYKEGKLHRIGGPATIDISNKIFHYYQNGKLHREDGPAVIDVNNGFEQWFKEGKLHRLDGHAVMYGNGTLEYYQDGRRHREDGPAFVSPSDILYYYKGRMITNITVYLSYINNNIESNSNIAIYNKKCIQYIPDNNNYQFMIWLKKVSETYFNYNSEPARLLCNSR